jgi:hypothetical protein
VPEQPREIRPGEVGRLPRPEVGRHVEPDDAEALPDQLGRHRPIARCPAAIAAQDHCERRVGAERGRMLDHGKAGKVR